MTRIQKRKWPENIYCPSGCVNSDKLEKLIYGHFCKKDSTWSKIKSWHSCCKSKRAYRHKARCKNRIPLDKVLDDLSDLKDIV